MDSLEFQTFGSYHIRCEIGRGGTWAVYLATDAKSGRDVALKITHQKPGDTDEVRTRRQNMFANEAHAAQVLEHQNIIKVLETGIEGDVAYLAMEYVEGAKKPRRIL